MEAIVSVLERAGRYLSLIRPMDVLDVAIIAYLVYKILCLVRSTRAENILKGVAIFLVALWLSSPAALNLRGVNYILSHMVEWGVLALIILFQPEIRQLLEKVGSRNIRLLRIFQPEQQSTELERAIDQTVAACTDMAKTRTGVLIVFERKLLLDEIVRSGTTLDAAVSSELLKNIFFVKAPMHDGAVIIRQGRILGAGCMLPLSKNVNLSRDLGMRHRAGIGMSENSRRGGGHRVGGDGLHLRGHRRHAEAAPDAGDAPAAAAQRADAPTGGGAGQAPPVPAGAAARP